MSLEREAVQAKHRELWDKGLIRDTPPVPTELERMMQEPWTHAPEGPKTDLLEKMLSQMVWDPQARTPTERLEQAVAQQEPPRDLFGKRMHSNNLSTRIDTLSRRVGIIPQGTPKLHPPVIGWDEPKDETFVSVTLLDTDEGRAITKEKELEKQMLAASGIEICVFCSGKGYWENYQGLLIGVDVTMPCTWCDSQGFYEPGRYDAEKDNPF